MLEDNRETKKYTDFTPEEVLEYLNILKKLVLNGKYIISTNENRRENIDFIEDYRIDSKKEKEILLNLQTDDFCYAVDNEKREFLHEKLYIFCKEFEFDNWGYTEKVEIYIKTNIIKTRKENDYLVVVSFHKRNRPITYLFRNK